MGAPMALRLLAVGHQVWVYNRTAAKTEPLVAAGATACATPTDVLAAATVTVLMLSDAPAIEAVLLPEGQPEPDLAAHTFIQMGTLAPMESQRLGQRLGALGASYLEAPVLGSIPEAKAGTLMVMVGAPAAEFAQWEPLLACLGDTLYHVGPVGQGAALKLAMNQLIGALTTGFATSLGLVQQAGIDQDQFMAVVRRSALYAPTFDKKIGRMASRNFANPNFPTKHLLKDMRLFDRAAAKLGLDTSVVGAISTVLERAVAQGLADSDYSSVFNVVSPLERDAP